MGNACCRASPNGDDVVTGGRVGIAPADPSGGQAQGRDAGGSGDGPTSAGRHQCHTSALDGWASDIEEEWHDALSEVDLAEALEEWEEGTLHGHDAGVDRAIEVGERVVAWARVWGWVSTVEGQRFGEHVVGRLV